MMIGEWIGADPFTSIQGTVHVVHDNYGILSFSSGQHFPDHRF